ncbi:MAG: Asp-tRNA(Asn)/Glu-tRNA(Gln) amidotransferase subunit GatA [bacterium]|nr:Asp-tRNA(Asn)/Glu-tRNA(Gln) amidotransferase subunit GatA [bacterium]
MSIDLKNLTIKKAHEALMRGDFTAVQLAEAYLDEIEKKNQELNVYLEVFGDVLEQAKEADEKIKAGQAGALAGIPMAIKDNFLIKGRKVSAASKILEGYRATYDATVIERIKRAGAVFLGRANMDEFAMGTSTEHSAFGPTKNPHDTERVSGGTSGGSAAAVAANMALAALGSDTGGSVRQPSSFCGVVGLKPTYGAVSRSGLIAMTSSFDVVGTVTKTADDAQILFDCLKGRDPLDSTSIEPSVNKTHETKTKMKIGVPWSFIEREGIDADVLESFKQSMKKLEKEGVEIQEVSVPSLEYALPAYYIIVPAEVSTNLARFDGVKYGARVSGDNILGDYLKTRSLFGAEARRRMLIGAYVLSSGYYDAYYRKATEVREKIRQDVVAVFEKNGIDCLAFPTTPTPAFKIGEKSQNPLELYLADIFTVSANIAGIPAISVPSGFVEREGKNMPLGLQFMAPHGREDVLFEVAKK